MTCEKPLKNVLLMLALMYQSIISFVPSRVLHLKKDLLKNSELSPLLVKCGQDLLYISSEKL